MDPKKAFLIVAIATIAMMASAWIAFTTYFKPSYGVSEEFAKCLSEKGFVMAGTMECPACQKQRALFGKSFEFINFKDCDRESEWCESNGIISYPTWVLPDGKKVRGVQTIKPLSVLSGCEA